MFIKYSDIYYCYYRLNTMNTIDFYTWRKSESAEKGKVRFWGKSESTFFRFGGKVNWRKREGYGFGGNGLCPPIPTYLVPIHTLYH